jgi:hypothetical protein
VLSGKNSSFLMFRSLLRESFFLLPSSVLLFSRYVTGLTKAVTKYGMSSSDECKASIGEKYDLEFVSLVVCIISCISSIIIFAGTTNGILDLTPQVHWYINKKQKVHE